MSTYDVKCSFIDVLQAESILNEFDIHSLETVSWKYLRYGKTKARIEECVHENVTAKGDFRQHLKDAPWDLLCEYVKGDAKKPVKIWRKQLTLLKQHGLCSRCKLEFDCILPTLQMTMNGMPLDTVQKEKNFEYLTKAIDKLHNEFMEKYNLPKFRVTAPKDIDSFCDMRGIPYRYKITLKGYNNVPFGNDYIKIDSAVEDLNLKGISKFLRNAKNMNDTSWATFVSRLQAKGEDYNCKVIKANRYFPSSKLCSCCGWKYEKLQLSEREWTCCNCGTHHIRDVNAAINLKNYVPLEEREFTPVESDKVKSLALLALQVGTLDEAGNHSQATSGRNVLGL